MVLYTCPDGETALIKTIAVTNNNVPSNQVAFYLGAAVAANALFAVPVGGTTGVAVNGLFLVLHPGDILRALTGALTVVVSGFGAELEGVAD